MLHQIVKADSVFLTEGKAILIEEFGKDYGIYFSILSAIARGKTSRSEIENNIGKEIGGYLTKLEADYEIITKNNRCLQRVPQRTFVTQSVIISLHFGSVSFINTIIYLKLKVMIRL